MAQIPANPAPQNGGGGLGAGQRLEAWKEIAAYLGREVRTVQRWERTEGLPIHRHMHEQAASVFAYSAELDAWRRVRTRAADILPTRASGVSPAPNPGKAMPHPPRAIQIWLILFSAIVVLAAACLYVRFRPKKIHVFNPVPFTTLVGDEVSPSFSPDARNAVFSWGHAGRFDIYAKPLNGGSPWLIAVGHPFNYSAAWSPDGSRIAFLSGSLSTSASLWIKALQGGSPYKIADTSGDVWPWYRGLTWMPNGREIVTIGREHAGDQNGLFLLSIESGAKKSLTTPPPGFSDFFPSVSPDGRTLVFSRVGAGVVGLYKMPLDHKEDPQPVIPEHTGGAASAIGCWTTNSRVLFVAVNQTGSCQFWRVPLSEKPILVASLSNEIIDLASSSDGRMLYSQRISDANLWIIPLSPGGAPGSPRRCDELTSTRDEYHAQYSPDGGRVAFESDRSGHHEIWIGERNGTDARALTHFNGPVTGSPAWSPDGKWLAFDSRINNQAEIFVVSSEGGSPKRVTSGAGAKVVPTWSHDGQWIYFASTAGGRHQIWRIRPDSRDPMQVSRDGGFAAQESTDGRFIYYTKSRESVTSLWRMPHSGGEEIQVAQPVLNRSFAIARRGVYFASGSNLFSVPALMLLQFDRSKPLNCTMFPHPIVEGLAISPDDRELMFGELDTAGSDLALVKTPD